MNNTVNPRDIADDLKTIFGYGDLPCKGIDISIRPNEPITAIVELFVDGETLIRVLTLGQWVEVTGDVPNGTDSAGM